VNDICLQIEAPGRTFHLRAESKAGLACWLMALEKYLSDRQVCLYASHPVIVTTAIQ
jgi:hypothetical protein